MRALTSRGRSLRAKKVCGLSSVLPFTSYIIHRWEAVTDVCPFMKRGRNKRHSLSRYLLAPGIPGAILDLKQRLRKSSGKH